MSDRRVPYAPYADPARDAIYHLLFADDPTAFRPAGAAALGAPWRALGSEPADVAALEELAVDGAAESRARILAWRRLETVGARPDRDLPLLGVVVEVGMDEGLDALAAYDDGSARYLNHAAAPAIVEGVGPLDAPIRALLAAAEPVARAIGPWEAARRPPPGPGTLRLTFLVGPEIRFGEGPIATLAADPMGGPVFAAATRLLQALTELQGRSTPH